MYIASLAVADLFVAATQAVLVAWQHPISHRVFEDCRALCLFLQCLCSAVEASSILSVFLIAMDRYVYIEYPFFYARVVTRTKVKVVIAVSWIICILSTRLLCRVVIGIFVDRDFDGCDVYAMLYESYDLHHHMRVVRSFAQNCVQTCPGHRGNVPDTHPDSLRHFRRYRPAHAQSSKNQSEAEPQSRETNGGSVLYSVLLLAPVLPGGSDWTQGSQC